MSQQQVQYVTAARNHEFHESNLNHLRKKKQTKHMLLSRSTVLSSVCTDQKGCFQVTDTEKECLHVRKRLVQRYIYGFFWTDVPDFLTSVSTLTQFCAIVFVLTLAQIHQWPCPFGLFFGPFFLVVMRKSIYQSGLLPPAVENVYRGWAAARLGNQRVLSFLLVPEAVWTFSHLARVTACRKH